MRFLKDLLLFLSPLLALTVLVETGLRRVDTMHFSRARALEDDSSPVQVLATGNSHEAVGIDCQALGVPCFNLASGSQTLMFDLRLLEKYRARFSGLKELLLGVSYQSIQSDLRAESSLSFEYWHAYQIDGEQHDLPWLDLRRFSLFATFGPERSLDYVLRGFKSGSKTHKPWAHLTAEAIVTRNMTDTGARRRLGQHHLVMKPGEVPRNVEALRGMIRVGKDLGARVTLLISPVSAGYQRNARPKDVALLRQTVSRVAAEEQVGLKDYWGDPRFTDEHFRDFDHLGPDGAALLTRLLREEVVEAKR